MKIENFPVEPLGEWIATELFDVGQKFTPGGLIMPDDNMKSSGIRPRWAKIIAISEKTAKELDLGLGRFILLEHLGWVKGMDLDMDDGTVQKTHWTTQEKIVLIADEGVERYQLPRTESEIK